MIIRPWAEFTSDLPDDAVEDDEGDFIQPGGKNVAEAVAGLLAAAGAWVDEPFQADDNSWQCVFEYKERRLWFQVTRIEGCIFVVEDDSWLSKLRGRPHPLYLEALNTVADALDRDPRFHDVRWYVHDQVMSGAKGAARPVEAA